MKPIFVDTKAYRKISKQAKTDAEKCGYVFISVPDPCSLSTLSDIKISDTGILKAAGLAILTSTHAMGVFGEAMAKEVSK